MNVPFWLPEAWTVRRNSEKTEYIHTQSAGLAAIMANCLLERLPVSLSLSVSAYCCAQLEIQSFFPWTEIVRLRFVPLRRIIRNQTKKKITTWQECAVLQYKSKRNAGWYTNGRLNTEMDIKTNRLNDQHKNKKQKQKLNSKIIRTVQISSTLLMNLHHTLEF